MPPTVDIVIKSYPPDYGWLAYCLKSIAKYASGFNDVIVMLPRSAPLNLTLEKTVYLDTPEGYLQQQVAKLNADLHTGADYVLHVDSDMVFTRSFSPKDFFHAGKPIWSIGPFDPESKKAWYHVMAKCLQECPPYEFMRKCAVLVPRDLYAKLREFIEQTHCISMDAYVMSQPGHEFSEYNCLGFYAWLKHRDRFHWQEINGKEDWPWIQHWSWGGLTPEIRQKLEEITK
tara:strand:- start:997 stop:1686 length:690 start_codon:yes stop_codon:yes gene_type:complete